VPTFEGCKAETKTMPPVTEAFMTARERAMCLVSQKPRTRGETDADRDGEPLRELHRRLSPPSQGNPTGFGWDGRGVPSRPTVVSQIVISPVSRRRTRSP
jgi:hypothetical protein